MATMSLASAAYAYLDAQKAFEEADDCGDPEEIAVAREKLLAAEQNYRSRRGSQSPKAMPTPRIDTA